MRHFLQLVALALLACTATHAQVFNPDNLIGKPPAPLAHQQAATEDSLQWLWQYAIPRPRGDKRALLGDPRFATLLHDRLKAPQAFWGTGVPLSNAAAAFLGGPGNVGSADNRHLTVNGCVVEQCPQRGLLWVDLGRTSPLVVFAALRWDEQAHGAADKDATFTLWLFPSRELEAHQLPDALKVSVQSWMRGDACPTYPVSNVIVVEPTGIAHIVGKLDAGLVPALCSSSPLPSLHSGKDQP